MYDLIVIGGGPAGSSAAITAARSAAKVLLLERGRLPRHKVCGEFVSGESLDLLRLLLSPEDVSLLTSAPALGQLRVHLDGRILRSSIRPAAASIARIDLDLALWHAASRIGVDVREQSIARSIEGTSPFLVLSSNGSFETRAVLNCTGRWSNLRAGAEEHPGPRWIGLKAHFRERHPRAGVDLYFFPGGYCGVSPVLLRDDASADRVNVCAMVRADVATSFAELFDQHPELRSRSIRWEPLMTPITTSPLIFHESKPSQDGSPLAGDAATFVDPFVGDGISLALRSGSLAARCLMKFLTGEQTYTAAIETYCHAYRQWLVPIFRNSSRIRRLLQLPKAVRVPIISVLEKAPVITEYLVSKTR